MSSARGDRKPCTYSDCFGIMHFSKYVPRVSHAMETPGPSAVGEEPGWLCDVDPKHFEGVASRAA
jgi:hypothetical protein